MAYSFLFSLLLFSKYLFHSRDLFIIFLERSFFKKGIWLPLACLSFLGAYLSSVLRVILQKVSDLSSIFVSETSNTAILPLIWSYSFSNLFLMKFIFKCANASLSGLLVRNDFRNLLQSDALSASSDSSESHMSNYLLKLSILCQNFR